MSQTLMVRADDLKKGMEYRVVYIGPAGRNISQIGNKVLRFRGRVTTGIAIMPTALSFGEDANPDSRYIIALSTNQGPIDVDAQYTFEQMYTGPMASGYGPPAGGRRRRAKSRRNRKGTRKNRRNTRK
jgi:hypothetical protein